MSLEIRRSIRGSYGPKDGDRLKRLLDKELQIRGLPRLPDPEPEERSLRRLPCGSAGAVTIHSLAKLAESARLPWTLGRWRSEAQVALPFDFPAPFRMRVGRTMLIIPVVQEFTSVRAIQAEVVALAPVLGIPLANGELSDAVHARINDCDGITDSEPPGWFESERSLWLDLYCACRYCLEDVTPLIIV